MLTLRLALGSLRNRLLPSTLTLASIAFSVTLLVGIENIRAGLRESFTGTVSGVDLIVGTRSSPVQLLLYSVFGMGSPTGSVSLESYEAFRSHPAVAWTIPFSLGDSHRGFRVVGTDNAFYEHFGYREGRRLAFRAGGPPADDHEVVLGSEVADRLGYGLGDDVVLTHGMGAAGIMDHDEEPFHVSGILERTGTPVDRSLYVTLEGVDGIHEDWLFGPPQTESVISGFFVGTPSRFEMLGLQREINEFEGEPLTAILPGIALAELWRTVGYAEEGLRIVSLFVVLVGLLGMVVSLYTALEARRREMAIFRAVGAGPGRIVSLLVVESGFLASAGALLGVLLVYGGIWVFQGPVEARFGLYIPLRPLGTLEWRILAAVVSAGFLVGFIPALKAYRSTLSDGLSPRS